MLPGEAPHFTEQISPFLPAGGALLLVLAAGLLLWALGGRILRPGLALIGLIAGLPLGIWLGGSVAPDAPSLLFAAGGALAGLVIASVSYRLALAAVTTLLASVLSVLGAWSAADLGWIDTNAAAATIDGATNQIKAATPPALSRETLTRLWLAASTGADAASAIPPAAALVGESAASLEHEHAVGHDATGIETVGDRSPGAASSAGGASRITGAAAPSSPRVGAGGGAGAAGGASSAGALGALEGGPVARTRAAVQELWASMPHPLRTLLMASLAAGAVIGCLFGLLFAETAARLVTSLAGSLLLLLSGMPLLSALLGRGDDLLPAKPAAWFVAIALLTVIGFGVQRMLAPAKPQAPQTAGA